MRAIYTAYLGWFDGNPTKLHPLPPADRAARTLRLMGGREAVETELEAALGRGDAQWALELCDLLLEGAPGTRAPLLKKKAQALELRAEEETSANGRHYYLSCARELRAEAERPEG